MDLDSDALAGVCDLFGGLTRAELARAAEELAFRRGGDFDRDAHDAAVADARETYALVVVPRDAAGDADVDAATSDADLVVPGPVAFPTLPESASDLPHILDVPRRDVPNTAVAAAVRERLTADIAALDDDADAARVHDLLDVTYDAATLADDDFADLRTELDGYV